MFHVFWFSKNWAEKIETSAFLSGIFIFWVQILWTAYVGGAEYYNYSIHIILSSSNSSHYIASKSDPKKWKWRSETGSFIFFPLNFLTIKLYRAPLNHINWQEMGTSPNEQPFLAAYKLWLASANAKTTPFLQLSCQAAPLFPCLVIGWIKIQPHAVTFRFEPFL